METVFGVPAWASFKYHPEPPAVRVMFCALLYKDVFNALASKKREETPVIEEPVIEEPVMEEAKEGISLPEGLIKDYKLLMMNLTLCKARGNQIDGTPLSV